MQSVAAHWGLTKEVVDYRISREGRFRSTTLMARPGSADRPLVICLHGFPDNALSFRHQATALREAGYLVACPMLPGYEAGSIPAGIGRSREAYTLERIAQRVSALITQLRADLGHHDQPVHLIGHDWGALIAYALVCRNPDLFRSLTTLTIPYGLSLSRALLKAPGYVRHAWYIQYFQLPRLPERRLPKDNWRFLDDLWCEWSPGWTMPEEVAASIKATLARPGVLQAALGFYRAIPGLSKSARASRRLMRQSIPTPALLIQGARDQCLPPAIWRLNRPDAFTGGYTHHTVATGHFPHQEDPETITRLIRDHLGRHSE